MAENSRNYFFWNKSTFEDAVAERVCLRCEYSGGAGVCHTKDPGGCALFRHLPQLVIIAQHLEEPTIEKYIQRVGEQIPMECGSLEGNCTYNDTLRCGMKKYLPLVLKAVLETDLVLESRV